MTSAQGLDKNGFLANEVMKRAFVRSLEVIGEAVKQVPMPLREQYPQAPWRASAGMRDRLIHGYATVDYEIVWETVTVSIPQLAETINLMLDRDDL
jgi:uncharacterized protein with HEPN domain